MNKQTNPEFYRISENESKNIGLHEQWKASHEANIACATYIGSPETGLSTKGYDGFSVDKDGKYLDGLIDKFGWRRTMCVLASTIHGRSDDGRISAFNKTWADNQLGYMNRSQTKEYVVSNRINPGMIDILARSMQKKYDGLGLYTSEHCEPNSYAEHDYTDKVLVISPEYLNEKYWSPENQLFYATTGFGCAPDASGRAVYGRYLADGEESRLKRTDFAGVMKSDMIPEWAKEKLEQEPEPEQNNEMELNM